MPSQHVLLSRRWVTIYRNRPHSSVTTGPLRHSQCITTKSATCIQQSFFCCPRVLGTSHQQSNNTMTIILQAGLSVPEAVFLFLFFYFNNTEYGQYKTNTSNELTRRDPTLSTFNSISVLPYCNIRCCSLLLYVVLKLLLH